MDENTEARSREGSGKLKGPGLLWNPFSKSGAFQQFLKDNIIIKEVEGEQDQGKHRVGTFQERSHPHQSIAKAQLP